ncbi:MAG TPA: BON domain-containing protein [Bacteroidia bacterium]|jgi:osmotically-inducible protein OsmY|nr:BON domain-containing protein [Bacteroidia bacterium]
MKKDAEIQKNVIEELKTIPLLKANEIGVAVKNGVVTLSGTVDSYPKKIRVEKAVKKIGGVKGIAEDIAVNLSEKHQKTDSEIAQMVINAIEWHSAAQIDKINILVEDGCVTLDGTTDWDFQRKSASKVVETIVGVKRITNNIKIAQRPAPTDIKTKIQAAFVRNARIDADKINIQTDGNKVILSGKVNCWSELEEAEHSVWSTPGVSSIENKLELEDDF